MKLTDIKTESAKEIIEETVLQENLGNLAKLNIGPLINVLKQPSNGRSGSAGPVDKKFQTYNIGSTSEIVDVGQLKDGLKSLRKAYKDQESARAFAVYIGGMPVMFGVFEGHTLAGTSRTGKLAYDLSAFKDTIAQLDAAKQATKPSWARPDPTRLSTYREKEPSQWDVRDAESQGKAAPKPTRYQGRMLSTSELAQVMTTVMEISKAVKEPVTAKLVLSDAAAESKRLKRYNSKQIETGVADLRTRLARFKNMKKPTVDTIEDFVAMSLKEPGKTVRFAGVTYNLTASSYDKLDPIALLHGKTFETRYRSTDPGVYDSLDLTYAFDPGTNQLKPIAAVWFDRSNPADRFKRQEAVLDPIGYAKMKLTLKSLDDKDIVVKKILEMFKSNRYNEILKIINSLRSAGIDWPELNAIEKSATIENENEKKSRGN